MLAVWCWLASTGDTVTVLVSDYVSLFAKERNTVLVRATSHFTKQATPPKITCIIPTSTRRISTNMNLLNAVIEVIELREAGISFSYYKTTN